MVSVPHSRNIASKRQLRIGLLGGSFNPAHEGHRAMSLYALKKLKLDQVWWLVSPQNPLKSAQDMEPFAKRIKKAHNIARHPRIVVTDIEAQLGTSYTVDTLRALKKRFSDVHFVWLMGSDNLQQIPLWHGWEEIFHRVPVAVFRRPGYVAGRGMGKAAQRFRRSWVKNERTLTRAHINLPAWRVLNNPLNYLSATQIRKGKSTWQKQKR